MFELLRLLAQPACCALDRVGATPHQILTNLNGHVDMAERAAVAQPAAATPTAAEAVQAITADKANLDQAGEGLPPAAKASLRQLDASVQKVQDLLKPPIDKQALAAATAEFHVRAAELGKLLGNGNGNGKPVAGPVDARSVDAKANQIKQLAGSVYATKEEEGKILAIMRETGKNPAEMQALLKSLDGKGLNYLTLFNRLSTGTNQAELVRLTAPAMDVAQKAQAIRDFAHLTTSSAQATAMLALFRDAAGQGQTESLLADLRTKDWSYLDLFKEMNDGDKEQFVKLTGAGMNTEQKAQAIQQFVDGYTPTDQEHAIAGLLDACPDHKARAELLASLESKKIDYNVLLDELESPADKARLTQSFLSSAQYKDLQATQDQVTAAEPQQQAAAARQPGLAAAHEQAETLAQQAGDLAAAKAPADGIAGNRKLIGQLDAERQQIKPRAAELQQALAAGKQEYEQLGRTVGELEQQVQALKAQLKATPLQGLGREQLDQQLQGMEGALSKARGTYERLSEGRGRLEADLKRLDSLDTALEARRTGALQELISAVADHASAEVKQELAPAAQTLQAYGAKAKAYHEAEAAYGTATEALQALPQDADAATRDAAAARCKQAFDARLGALEELRVATGAVSKSLQGVSAFFEQAEQDATHFRQAKPDPLAAPADYDKGIKAEEALQQIEAAAGDGNSLLDDLVETTGAAEDELTKGLTAVGEEMQASHLQDALFNHDIVPARGEQLRGSKTKSFGQFEQKLQAINEEMKDDKARLQAVQEQKQWAQGVLARAPQPGADVPVQQQMDQLKAKLVMETADQEIEALQGALSELSRYRNGDGTAENPGFAIVVEAERGLRTQKRDMVNQCAKALGLEGTDSVDDKELDAAIGRVQQQLGLTQEAGAPDQLNDDKLLQAISQETNRRVRIGDTVINGALKNMLGFSDEQLRARGVSRFDDASLGQGISLLRQQLGVTDQPPGAMSPLEKKELEELATTGQVKPPVRSSLMTAIQARQRGTVSFTNGDMVEARKLLARFPGGRATAAELAQALRDGKLPQAQRDVALQLLQRADTPAPGRMPAAGPDGHPASDDRLVPSDLFKVVSGGSNELNADTLDRLQRYLDAAQGGLPVQGLSDQRAEAEKVFKALRQDRFISIGSDTDSVFAVFGGKSRAELQSLALAYKAEHGEMKDGKWVGKDLMETIHSKLSTRDLGQVLFAFKDMPIKDRVDDYANPELARKIIANPATLKDIERRFQRTPEVCDEARQVVSRYQASQDPQEKEALQKRFTELMQVNTARIMVGLLDPQGWKDINPRKELSSGDAALMAGCPIYGAGKGLAMGIDWLCDPGAFRNMDISGVQRLMGETSTAYNAYEAARQNYVKAQADPARQGELDGLKQDMAAKQQVFLEKSAASQQEMEKQLAKEVQANEDYGARLDTAIGITKGVAVAATATVVTLATFGAGTAASAGFITTYGGAVVTGTLAGTAMRVGLDAEQRYFEKGSIGTGKEFWESTQTGIKESFTAALGTVTGLGFAKFGQAGVAATNLSRGAQALNMAKQFAIGGTMNTLIDTSGKVIQGDWENITWKRAAFTFATGGVQHLIGQGTSNWSTAASLTKDAALGTGFEMAWNAASGRPLDENLVQTLVSSVIVGTVSVRGNKWIEHAQHQALVKKAMAGVPPEHAAGVSKAYEEVVAKTRGKTPEEAMKIVQQEHDRLPPGVKEAAAGVFALEVEALAARTKPPKEEPKAKKGIDEELAAAPGGTQAQKPGGPVEAPPGAVRAPELNELAPPTPGKPVVMPESETPAGRASEIFAGQNRLGPGEAIPDGYVDGGKSTKLGSNDQITSGREVLVVDRSRDTNLQRFIGDAEQMKALPPEQRVKALAEYVDKLMNAGNDRNAVQPRMEAWEAGRKSQEVLLGDVPALGGGMCRHRALLFKVLGDAAGLEVGMVRGRMKYTGADGQEAYGGHAWNEVALPGGKKVLVDVMNPRNGGFDTLPSLGDPQVAAKYMTEARKPIYTAEPEPAPKVVAKPKEEPAPAVKPREEPVVKPTVPQEQPVAEQPALKRGQQVSVPGEAGTWQVVGKLKNGEHMVANGTTRPNNAAELLALNPDLFPAGSKVKVNGPGGLREVEVQGVMPDGKILVGTVERNGRMNAQTMTPAELLETNTGMEVKVRRSPDQDHPKPWEQSGWKVVGVREDGSIITAKSGEVRSLPAKELIEANKPAPQPEPQVMPRVDPQPEPVAVKPPLDPQAAAEFMSQARNLMQAGGKEFELKIPSSKNAEGFPIKGKLVEVGDNGTLYFLREDGKRFGVPKEQLAAFHALNPEFIQAARTAPPRPAVAPAAVGAPLNEKVRYLNSDMKEQEVMLPGGQKIKGILINIDPDGSLRFFGNDRRFHEIPADRLGDFMQANPAFAKATQDSYLAAIPKEAAKLIQQANLPEFELNIPSSRDPKGIPIKGILTKVEQDGTMLFTAVDGQRYRVPPDRLGTFESRNPGFVQAAREAVTPLRPAELSNVQVQIVRPDGTTTNEGGWKVKGVTPEGNIQVEHSGSGTKYLRDIPADEFFRLNSGLVEGDTAAFVEKGGLQKLAQVKTAPPESDHRARAAARLGDVAGDEGRVAVNRGVVEELYKSRLKELQAANPAEFKIFVSKMKTSTPTEKVILQRALASGASIKEINTFIRTVGHIREGNYAAAGIKDPQLIAHLKTLTPEQRVLAMTTLEGHQQAFTTSCNPTSAQIVRGEVDPIYALAGRLNPNKLVAEQGRMMKVNEGVAVFKGGLRERLLNAVAPDGTAQKVLNALGIKHGQGTWPKDIARELNTRLKMDRFGLRYEAVDLPVHSQNERSQALVEIARSLDKGVPTEIYVNWKDAAGNTSNPQTGQPYGAHAIAVIDSQVMPGGGRRFLLHDPEFPGGKHTVWVSGKDLAEGHLGPTYKQYGSIGEFYSYLRVDKVGAPEGVGGAAGKGKVAGGARPGGRVEMPEAPTNPKLEKVLGDPAESRRIAAHALREAASGNAMTPDQVNQARATLEEFQGLSRAEQLERLQAVQDRMEAGTEPPTPADMVLMQLKGIIEFPMGQRGDPEQGLRNVQAVFNKPIDPAQRPQVEQMTADVATRAAKVRQDAARLPEAERVARLEAAHQEIDALRHQGSSTLNGNGFMGDADAAAKMQGAQQRWQRGDDYVRMMVENGGDLNLNHIEKLNSILREGSGGDPPPGELRWNQERHGVGVGDGDCIDPIEVPKAMADFVQWYNDNKATMPAPELAARAYQRMISIHPFSDGNGRTARLVMDFILEKNGLPPVALDDPKAAVLAQRRHGTDPSPTDVTQEVLKAIQQSLAIQERHLQGK